MSGILLKFPFKLTPHVVCSYTIFSAIDEIRQNGIMALTKIKFSIEQLWTDGLENTQTLLQFNELFKELLDKLETAEEELRLIFSNLVSVTRIIVDPAVKLLVQMIESKPLDEQMESKVLVQFHEILIF